MYIYKIEPSLTRAALDKTSSRLRPLFTYVAFMRVFKVIDCMQHVPLLHPLNPTQSCWLCCAHSPCMPYTCAPFDFSIGGYTCKGHRTHKNVMLFNYLEQN